ncbi:hypothetical protein BDF20DRAFT_984660 [Mycotypha africana]|uniref:uncharacterized protein n=1 Tax=Mycotypha africana TaxID=64632 RepID=UPI00230072BC|nr:uncharacterized protein BDF20DRAFT_984660 [Mycotypha africana]KAI8992109.1 hypothetical protein BDF20DRAFT_984660 [Mycotypha africana]
MRPCAIVVTLVEGMGAVSLQYLTLLSETLVTTWLSFYEKLVHRLVQTIRKRNSFWVTFYSWLRSSLIENFRCIAVTQRSKRTPLTYIRVCCFRYLALLELFAFDLRTMLKGDVSEIENALLFMTNFSITETVLGNGFPGLVLL